MADILSTAVVSKGALYHHFDSKQNIAEIVFATASRDAVYAAARRASNTLDPLEALVESCLHWLNEVSDPAVAVILFDLGPTALGWEQCRRIEGAHALRAIRLGIDNAIARGRFSPTNTQLAGHTINAVLAELAWLRFETEESEFDERAVAATVRKVISALAQVD